MSATLLKERLREDLKSAMREKRSDEVALLRTLIAALDNAEAVPTEGYRPRALADAGGEVARRELDGRAVEALLAEEVESRLTAAADYDRHSRPDEAARLRDEAALVARYAAL